jgi:glycerate 2-kinase
MKVEARPQTPASQQCLRVYERTLDRIAGDRLTLLATHRERDQLRCGNETVSVRGRTVWVAGAGKAAVPMVRALLERIPEAKVGPVVTKRGFPPDPVVEFVGAGHPIPDAASVAAGRAMLQWAQTLGDSDLVLFALSGGASALLEVPIPGLTLEDLERENRRLLASGAPIEAVNAERRRLSALKAGGLAAALAPAEAVVLVISDVEGNDLATIGSGPFFGGERVRHVVVGDLQVLESAAVEASGEVGLEPVAVMRLVGEAREFDRRLERDIEGLRPGQCLLYVGETTVTVRGAGRGGRCQELAAACAPVLERSANTSLLAGSTDGTDGPTETAGALVDPGSRRRAADRGVHLEDALARNDSEAFLAACDGLIVTGHTGSNLTDLVVAVRT